MTFTIPIAGPGEEDLVDVTAQTVLALRGGKSLAGEPGVAELAIDAQWRVAVNPHGQAMTASDGAPLPPYCFYVTYNGWPWSLFHPMDSEIACGNGAGANVQTYLAACRAAIAKAKGATDG